MKKDLLTILDLTRRDIEGILQRAKVLKAEQKGNISHRSLKGKTMAMIFKKPSTRTRVSFETGIFQMGGLALDLNRESLQIGRGESIPDTARVLSRYVDIILIRTYDHAEVEQLAAYASIPVINGLTDMYHPCQVLSDLFTIKEFKGGIEDVRIAYIGDGNNVTNSWLNAAGIMGLDLRIACPSGFEPDKRAMELSRELLSNSGGSICMFDNPKEAVAGADIIYTDVWVSMGQEDAASRKRERFLSYQVNKDLIENASEDVLIMHCLPAHRGEEITDDVLDGPNSIVFDQAENRLHVQKAIVEALILRMNSE